MPLTSVASQRTSSKALKNGELNPMTRVRYMQTLSYAEKAAAYTRDAISKASVNGESGPDRATSLATQFMKAMQQAGEKTKMLQDPHGTSLSQRFADLSNNIGNYLQNIINRLMTRLGLAQKAESSMSPQ